MNMFHFGSFAHCYVPFCSLNQGSGFGELALQDDAPRAATIITCVGVPQDERGGGRWVFGAKAGGERRCWVEVFVKSKKHVIWGLSWIKLTTPYQGIWHWVFVLSFMSKIIRKWLLFLAFHWRKLDSEPGKQSLSIVWNLKSLTKFGGSNFSQTLSDVMADHHHRCALKLCRAKNPSKFLDHWTVKKCVSSHLKHRWMENSSFPGKCRLSNHHKGALRAVCQDLRKKQKSLLHLLDEDFVAKNVWSCCSRSGDFVLSCRAGQNSTVSQAAQIWLKLRLK